MRPVAAALMVVSMFLIHRPVWAQDVPVDDTRPAIPTFWGDTGLWFVPTAETAKGMSFSVYRSEFDYSQGFTNVSFWPVTASVGIGRRVEAFGSLRVITRIDRDTRPLFYPALDGGVVNDYPFVRETWTGNDLGDLFTGAKVNLLSQSRNQGIGLAFRGTVKIPLADEETGAGTGKPDYFTDVIVSRELGRRVEVSGYGGYAYRGDPDNLDLADSFRWGIGAGFGSRSPLRFTTELWGERPTEDAVVVTGFSGLLRSEGDGSTAPVLSNLRNLMHASLGVTYQGAGVALGVGLTYHFDVDRRSDVNPALGDVSGDAVSVQFRVGFHNGVRAYRAPDPPAAALAPPPAPAPEPPPAPAPPPPPAPVVNRPPTLTVNCDPCQVTVGESLALLASGQDPDGDTLSYRWTTPSGTIGDPTAASTRWTAQTTPGPLVVTVTADDGRGGVATGRVNLQVVAPARLAFDDIVFDFDRDVIRPDAMATLQAVVSAMRANPGMRIQIEGHASAEGTAEYNLALGERRAGAVRAFLTGQGIDAGRMSTISYGEERPRFDNSTEANRALNRRAAFVVQ